MVETRIWRASRTRAAEHRASRASSGRRAALRVWTLLHAQALLSGTIGSVDGVAFIEDDHRRLAARREN